MTTFRMPRLALGAGIAFVLAVSGLSSATAQSGNTDDKRFGAWISEGTCDALTDQPLIEIGGLEVDDDDDAARDLELPATVAMPIYMEDEDLDDLTYATLGGSPHVVVVRASEDVTSDVIACGEITNVPTGTDAFTVTLQTMNDSGFTGQARFTVEPDDDHEEIEVVVGVWAGTSTATPAA